MAIAGDSSGANVATAAPLRLRDGGHAMPDAVIALGPVTDSCVEEYASFNEQAPRGIVYDAAFAGFMRGAYLRHDQWNHPHASPMNGDLTGYPPAMLVVGSHDGMIDSARAFAGKLRVAGNRHVDFSVRAGMPHGFSLLPRPFPAGGRRPCCGDPLPAAPSTTVAWAILAEDYVIQYTARKRVSDETDQ